MAFPLCTLSLESLIVPGAAFKPVLRLTHGPVPCYVFQARDSGLCSDLRPHMMWISEFKQAQKQNWSLQSICPNRHMVPRLQCQSCPATCSLPPLTCLICTMMNSVTLFFRKKPKPTLLIPNLLVKAFRIPEWMGLEGTLKTIQSQPFEDIQGWSSTRLRAFALLKPCKEFRPGLRSWTEPEDFT